MLLPKLQDQDILIDDAIHLASYRNESYKQTKHVNVEDNMKKRYSKITVDDVKKHLKSYFTPDRSFLVATGVDAENHENLDGQLSDMFEKFYSKNNLGSEKIDDLVLQNYDQPPRYNYGYYKHKKDYIQSMSAIDLPLLTHFNIIYPSPGYNDIKNYACMEIIKALLGGGDAFSAGGPGKGMYARFYKKCLATGIFYTINFKIIPYNEQSLASIHFAAHNVEEYTADQNRQLKDYALKSVMNEMNSLVHTYSQGVHLSDLEQEELFRAKNQLKMRAFIELEQKPQQFEDFCKQIAFREKWVSPKEWSDIIDEISAEDIGNMVETYWKRCKPSVAIVEPSDSDYNLNDTNFQHIAPAARGFLSKFGF